jgi:hypothetical protein
MKFPWRLNWRRGRELGAAAVLAATWNGVAFACGPEFPNSYYALPERELLRGPDGFFAAEIARLAPRAPSHRAVRMAGVQPRVQTLEVDIADVKQALAERGMADIDRTQWHYESARRALEAWVEARRAWDPKSGEAQPQAPEIKLPARVPAEFRLYLEGAVAWHEGKLDAARTAWAEVLALPASERRFRGVWAAFMLGRLEADVVKRADPRERAVVVKAYGEARRRLQETRAMVAEGARDPLGLAAASLGWEAQAALSARDFATAMQLYLEQHATGDETALESLREAARAALAPAERDLVTLAKMPDVRRVLTAHLIARARPSFEIDYRQEMDLRDWAAALEQAGVVGQPEADRLAWAAYNAGAFALATRWAALAPAEAAEANWIRAKLALRRGDLSEGERLLRSALKTETLGDAHRAQVAAELSRVCLSQDDYAGALDAALNGGHWEDAAFVAERVMSLEELRAFVERQRVSELPPWEPRVDAWQPADLRWRLRHLLARRLARAGRTGEAAEYFPGEWEKTFRAYVADVRIGFSVERPARERGEAFWRAAQAMREHGMDLLGTELDPDWAIWSGDFAMSGAGAARRDGPGAEGGVLAPTPLELERLAAQRVPEKRFHYRYRAAELAWWAASLLPNDADETAKILATAGGWLKARDPEAAKPFYQALVIRCGNTALGRAAAQKRWFPANPLRDGD